MTGLCWCLSLFISWSIALFLYRVFILDRRPSFLLSNGLKGLLRMKTLYIPLADIQCHPTIVYYITIQIQFPSIALNFTNLCITASLMIKANIINFLQMERSSLIPLTLVSTTQFFRFSVHSIVGVWKSTANHPVIDHFLHGLMISFDTSFGNF